MKRQFIKATGFFWGVPATLPSIRGFEIIADPRGWLIARQGEREFVVQSHRQGFRLFPFANPVGSGRFVEMSKAIFIPKGY